MVNLELEVRDDIGWGDVPWSEVHSTGYHDELAGKEGVIPSHYKHDEVASPDLYTDADKVRRTAGIVLDQTVGQMRALEQKVVDYQDAEKARDIQVSRDVEAGTADIHMCFAGGTSPEKMAEAYRKMGSKEHRDKIRASEIHSVDLGDSLRYSGLVKVAQGMQQMIETGEILPEAVGRHFQEVYQGLE